MAKSISPILLASDSFGSWISKTNTAIDLLSSNVVTTADNAFGDNTVGNGYVTGIFGANTIVATNIRGGNVATNTALTFSSNTSFGNSSVNTHITLNNVSAAFSGNVKCTTTAAQIVDSFSTAVYRSAKYIISATDNANNKYQATEIMLLHDGTNAYTTEYATLISSTTVAQFSANVDGTTLRFFATPTYADTTLKINRSLLAV